jgi:flagellar biosynthesis/type III secretory pathway protein FliH
MAKKLYEEEKISNIAQKIKQFVPYLHIDGFTTKEMADGVEHVHEAGKARGLAEGYDRGFDNGARAVKIAESRTEDDIILDGDSFTVPSGYYARSVEKHINIDPFYDAGFEDGYEKGKSEITYEDGNEVAY